MTVYGRFLTFCFLLAGAVGSSQAFAQKEMYRRLVNFEWEAIQGAHSYDLELDQNIKDGKKFKFKVKSAEWSGQLTPGSYNMRLRALDDRGVPGEWSESSLFQVGLDNVQIQHPESNKKVFADRDDKSKVELKWKAVPGATNYKLTVETTDGSFKESFETDETSYLVKLPVAKKVNWSITAFGTSGIESDATTTSQFDFVGPSIENPKIEKPENEFVRAVKWAPVENAEKYDISVYQLNTKEKKWKLLKEIKDHPTENINFEPQWDGGTYRVDVMAQSELRKSSPKSTTKFKVRKGDRSPASEFRHEVRKSIDRINGWYGIASYMITMINNRTEVPEALRTVDGSRGSASSAVGGTGRLGLGFFKEEQPWGFLSIVDLSGFTNVENKNITYGSYEASAVWRKSVGERGEFRSQMGLFNREYPVIIGIDKTNQFRYEKGSAWGPHLSAEYWYSMTPKLGLQANTHFYLNAIKDKTPNGASMRSSVSSQFGLLGSYRFNKRFTGLMGYVHREDTFVYDSGYGGNISIQLNGDYLNFFAEYSF